MVATVLQAAPMSTTQQVDVLNVVTELGTLLRNQRAENVQVREDVQQMRERLDTQLNDYARRLSLAEARGAISAAMGAGGPTRQRLRLRGRRPRSRFSHRCRLLL